MPMKPWLRYWGVALMTLGNVTTSVGSVNEWTGKIEPKLEKVIQSILKEACIRIIRRQDYDRKWEETVFMFKIKDEMQSIKDEWGYHLLIDREVVCDDADYSSKPKKAPRIDIRVLAWIENNPYYGIEGKILVQSDWEKRKASDLRQRYINTGIDNFRLARYCNYENKGCLLGIVIAGSTESVIGQINRLLQRRGRVSETLQNLVPLHKVGHYSNSKHTRVTDNRAIILHHFIFGFNE